MNGAVLQTQFDLLPVEVYPDEYSLGQAAAEAAARALRAAVSRRGQANVIVATGNSQLSFYAALRERRLPPNIVVDEFFFLAGSRLGMAVSQQNYISANYTHALRYVLDRGVNVVAQLVAKRVRNGATRYSLSCNTDLTLELMTARRDGRVRR